MTKSVVRRAYWTICMGLHFATGSVCMGLNFETDSFEPFLLVGHWIRTKPRVG